MHLKTLLFGKHPRVFTVRAGIGRGLKLHLHPQKNSQRILGLAEAEVAGAFRQQARACDRYIELGASDGYYCIVTRRANPAAELIAFEPQAHFAPVARENFARNGLATDRLDWRQEFGGTPERPLSAYIDPTRRLFMKIDVDGGEVDALRSVGDRWPDFHGALLVEVHSAALRDGTNALLQAAGFRCTRIAQAWWRRIIPERRPIALNEWILATKP
jgi:hypothetical protein